MNILKERNTVLIEKSKLYIYIFWISIIIFSFSSQFYEFVGLFTDQNTYRSWAIEWHLNGIDVNVDKNPHLINETPSEPYQVTLNRQKASLLMIYPITFFYNIFGINYFSSCLYLNLCTLFTFILIFFISKILFGEKVGFYCVFVYALLPLTSVWLNIVLVPDSISNFYLLFPIFLILLTVHKLYKLNFLLIIVAAFISVVSTLARQWLPLSSLILLTIILSLNKKERIKNLYFLLIGFILGIITLMLLGKLLMNNYLYYAELYYKYTVVFRNEYQVISFYSDPLVTFRSWFYPALTSFLMYVFIFSVLILIIYRKEINIKLLFISLLIFCSFFGIFFPIMFTGIEYHTPYSTTCFPFFCITVGLAFDKVFSGNKSLFKYFIIISTSIILINLLLPFLLQNFVGNNSFVDIIFFKLCYSVFDVFKKLHIYTAIIVLSILAIILLSIKYFNFINQKIVKIFYFLLLIFFCFTSVFISSYQIEKEYQREKDYKSVAKFVYSLDNSVKPKFYLITEISDSKYFYAATTASLTIPFLYFMENKLNINNIKDIEMFYLLTNENINELDKGYFAIDNRYIDNFIESSNYYRVKYNILLKLKYISLIKVTKA